jgi:hypothetical protein
MSRQSGTAGGLQISHGKKTDSKKACPVKGVYLITPFIKSTVLSSSHFALPIYLRAILPSLDKINVAGTR